VESTIRAPDRQMTDPTNRRLTRAYKKLAEAGGRVLRVVYLQAQDDILVVTAFPDRDAE
jgi:hypothetical protein